MSSSDEPAVPARNARHAIGAMFFLIGALNASWVSRIPAMRDRLELGDADLGLLLLTPAVGAMIAFRFAGGLVGRYGSRRITRIVTGLLCGLVLLPGLAPTPFWAAVSLLLFGATSGMMDVSINAHGVEVEAQVGRPILGSLHGLVSCGRLVGAAGGAVAAWASLSPAFHLLIAGIVFQGVTQLLGPGLLRDRGTVASAARRAPTGEVPAPSAPVVTRPTGLLVALGVLCFCSSASEGAMADWSGVYLRDMLHTSEALAASAYAAFSLAMLAGRFAGDRVTVWLGAAGVVRYGGLLVVTSMALGLATNTVPTMMLAFMCVGLGVSVLVPTAFRAGARVPGVAPGAAIATLATVSYAAFFCGPPIIGFVSDHVTLRGGLLIIAALGLVLVAFAPAVEGRTIRVLAWFTARRSPPAAAPVVPETDAEG